MPYLPRPPIPPCPTRRLPIRPRSPRRAACTSPWSVRAATSAPTWCRAWCASGWRVRAAARNRDGAARRARRWPGVDDLVEADALQPETLAAALAGVDIAYYLVHSMAAGARLRPPRPARRPSNFAAPRPRPACGASSTSAAWCPTQADSEHLVSRKRHRRAAARGPGAGDRDPRRHHRRPGLGRLRGDARPRLPPAGDGDAALGAVASRAPIALANLLEYLVRVADAAAGRAAASSTPAGPST
ncbi:MAG: hypothetical protein MZV65_13195 [Chromatiales bacterium]|nr:hypothetical protein [Chromatiales bacterium]